MSVAVHIPQFEGPLGLLLFLIRKEEMDIFDIDIHQITSQYLEYIKKMKQFDLEMAGDFVAMAATLIQIKAKMLLPNYNEEGEEEEIEDPRKELVAKLIEYQQFQEVAKKIYEKPLLGRDVYRRGKGDTFVTDGDEEIIVDEGGLFALIGLYRGAIRRAKRAVHRVARKTQSIAARIIEIKDRLVVGQRVVLRDLLVAADDFRSQILVTFLSCLELGKMGYVHVYQSEVYGDIYLTATKEISGNVVERVEEYDSQDSEQIAMNLMDEAEEEEREASMVSREESTPAESPEGDDIVSEDVAHMTATDEEIEAAEGELGIDSSEPAVEFNLAQADFIELNDAMSPVATVEESEASEETSDSAWVDSPVETALPVDAGKEVTTVEAFVASNEDSGSDPEVENESGAAIESGIGDSGADLTETVIAINPNPKIEFDGDLS